MAIPIPHRIRPTAGPNLRIVAIADDMPGLDTMPIQAAARFLPGKR